MLTPKNPTFSIKTVLIYNPTLKPLNEKSIQQEIQQAKIIFYYPSTASIYQKRNHVGLAEGVFEFFDFYCDKEIQQNHQIISTNREILIIKQCQVNIWIMLGLKKVYQYMYTKERTKYMCKQYHNYEHQQFEQKVCVNIINHFYNSFKIFYGTISSLVRENIKIPNFTKLMTEFISRYTYINQNESSTKLDLNYYLYGGIKPTAFNQNYMLKYNYLNSILKATDPSIKQTIIFNNGYLALSTLNPQITLFFFNYFYSSGESLKFDEQKIFKKFINLKSFIELGQQRYGYFINSKHYGFGRDKKNDSVSQQNKKKSSLYLQAQININLIQIFLTINEEQKIYKLNTYLDDKLLFITFSANQPKQLSKIQYQNKFFRENIHKLQEKNYDNIMSFSFQNQSNRFIYLNLINLSGKVTFSESNINQINTHLRFIIRELYKTKQKFVLFQLGMNILYGVRHLNRILIIQVSAQLGLNKIEDYLDKLAKNYFPLIYI